MPLIFIDPHILLCPCSFPETRIQFFMQASWLVFSWFSVQCVGVTVTLLKVTDEWLHIGTHSNTGWIHHQSEKDYSNGIRDSILSNFILLLKKLN